MNTVQTLAFGNEALHNVGGTRRVAAPLPRTGVQARTPKEPRLTHTQLWRREELCEKSTQTVPVVMQLSDARWSRDECLRGRTQLQASKQKSSCHRRASVSSDVVKGHMTRSMSLGPRSGRPVSSACTRIITRGKACSLMMRLRRDDDQQHPVTEAQEGC